MDAHAWDPALQLDVGRRARTLGRGLCARRRVWREGVGSFSFSSFSSIIFIHILISFSSSSLIFSSSSILVLINTIVSFININTIA
jgi:hypothetical protein